MSYGCCLDCGHYHERGQVCLYATSLGACQCRGVGLPRVQALVERDERDEQVDHPPHYGGADDPYETIKVLEAWGIATPEAYLFNVIKYLSRAGKKGDQLQDLRKAQWYLNQLICRLDDSDNTLS